MKNKYRKSTYRTLSFSHRFQYRIIFALISLAIAFRRYYFSLFYTDSKLYSILLIVTEKCNLKCRMCDIWQRGGAELSLDVAGALFESKSLHSIQRIHISGGEAFLYPELMALSKLIVEKFPRSTVTISTNGTCTKAIKTYLTSTPIPLKKLKIYISLDGIQGHDEVRGVDGSFKRVQATIQMLRKEFPQIRCCIKCLISPWNLDEIHKVADFTYTHNVAFGLKLIENVKQYTNNINYESNKSLFEFTPKEKEKVVEILSKYSCDSRGSLGERYYMWQSLRMLTSGKVKKSCFFPNVSLQVHPDTSIYTCRHHESIGLLQNGISLDKMLCNDQARTNIARAQKGICCTDCVSRQALFY